MTALRPSPPLTQLNAYVELSPDQVVDWIEEDNGLQIVDASPPGRVIELLVTDGGYTTWMSVRAICDGGSVLAEVIAADDDDAELPPVRSGAEDQP